VLLALRALLTGSASVCVFVCVGACVGVCVSFYVRATSGVCVNSIGFITAVFRNHLIHTPQGPVCV
jgi:hypothetical protein